MHSFTVKLKGIYIYIELPPEDSQSRSGEIVGKLNKAMYGTRDAPQIWQGVVEAKMRSLGFELSYFHPSVYRHKQREILVIAHVDDFMCLGKDADLRWMFNALKSEYNLKMELLSAESGDSHSVKFLNRTITMG